MIPFHPYADIFPLIEGAEFEALVQGMREHGYRNGEEIVLLDGMILDGRNRYRAAIAAGIITADDVPHVGAASWIFCEFSSEGGEGLFSETEVEAGPMAFVIAKNVNRRHLDESQRAMVAARLANLGEGRPVVSAAMETAQISAVSQTQAAELLNVSRRTVQTARFVQDKAEPELRAVVEGGKLAVSAAAKAVGLPAEDQRKIAAAAEAGKANVVRTVIKQGHRAVREELLGAKITALTPLNQLGAKYGVIVADPEWRFEVRSRETGLDRSADNHYPTSDDATIAARDVASIAAEDCVLGLWVTDLARGIDTLRAWGFEYKSYFVWVKDIVRLSTSWSEDAGTECPLLMEKGPAGTGYWNTDRDELLLIGTRGNPVCPAPGTQGESCWFAERPRDAEDRIIHSAKPDCSLAWFEKHYPNTPKIELNARRARAGWAQWGNEAPAGVVEPAPEPAPAAQAAPSALSEAGARLAGVEASAVGDAMARMRASMGVPAKAGAA